MYFEVMYETLHLSNDSEDKWKCSTTLNQSSPLMHNSTNPGDKNPQVIRFCTTAPNICGSSIRNSLRVILLESRILRWFQNMWKICGPLPQFRQNQNQNNCWQSSVQPPPPNHTILYIKKGRVFCALLYIDIPKRIT